MEHFIERQSKSLHASSVSSISVRFLLQNEMTAKQRKSRPRTVSSFGFIWNFLLFTESEREPNLPETRKRKIKSEMDPEKNVQNLRWATKKLDWRVCAFICWKSSPQRRCALSVWAFVSGHWALWPHHQHCNARCCTSEMGRKIKSTKLQTDDCRVKTINRHRWGEIPFGCQLASCLVGDLFACLLWCTHTLSVQFGLLNAAMAIVRILSMFYYSICWSSFCNRFFFIQSFFLHPVCASLWFKHWSNLCEISFSFRVASFIQTERVCSAVCVCRQSVIQSQNRSFAIPTQTKPNEQKKNCNSLGNAQATRRFCIETE